MQGLITQWIPPMRVAPFRGRGPERARVRTEGLLHRALLQRRGPCRQVVRRSRGLLIPVVADGSTDQTAKELREAAADGEAGGRVRVLTLEGNRGKGAALLAGFNYALAHLPFDVLVTMDGDSQHRPADIPRLVQACTEGSAAMVIGERFAPGCGPVPWRSRIGNTLATLVLRWRYFPAQSSRHAVRPARL